MKYLIKVSQPTQVQIVENNRELTKTLLPDHKYIVDDCKNTQLCDLKKTRCIVVKEAKEREISCFESIRLN